MSNPYGGSKTAISLWQARRLKKAVTRKKRKLTYKQAAERWTISVSTVGRIIAGVGPYASL